MFIFLNKVFTIKAQFGELLCIREIGSAPVYIGKEYALKLADKIKEVYSDEKYNDRIILLSAFRYALGRKSCGVDVIIQKILAGWDNLDEDTKQLIVSEIVEWVELYDRSGHSDYITNANKEKWLLIVSKYITSRLENL